MVIGGSDIRKISTNNVGQYHYKQSLQYDVMYLVITCPAHPKKKTLNAFRIFHRYRESLSLIGSRLNFVAYSAIFEGLF